MNKNKDVEEKFKEISEAYAVLSDDQKRAQYDQFGHDGFDQRFSREDIFRDFDFDVFRDFGFGNFDNIFDTFFGRQRTRREEGGIDLRYDLRLTFEEAVKGAEKELEIERNESCSSCNGTGSKDKSLETCEECNGRGQVQSSRRTPFGYFTQITPCRKCNGSGEVIKHPCTKCNGSGLNKINKKLKMKVPPGVDNGTQIKISGEGEITHDKIAGDLLLYIHVIPSKIFERDGDDIYYEQKISITQAAIGCTIEVPTVDGRAKLEIPPGTQNSTMFRLKGLGVKHIHYSGRGDMFVKVTVDIPKNLTKRQRELLEEFEKQSSETKSQKESKKKKFFSF